MGLIEEAEQIRKKQKSKYTPGSVECIFEYNKKCSRDESGMLPVIIKSQPDQPKKTKSIN